jgi:hypothetical protein
MATGKSFGVRISVKVRLEDGNLRSPEQRGSVEGSQEGIDDASHGAYLTC